MARLFDLHIHTTKGSSDSSLNPEELILEANRLGLRGLCITEHSGPWERHDFERFASQHSVVLVRAMEVETDMGHMLAFGMDRYQPGFHKAEGATEGCGCRGWLRGYRSSLPGRAEPEEPLQGPALSVGPRATTQEAGRCP